jgi:hypothetical protein
MQLSRLEIAGLGGDFHRVVIYGQVNEQFLLHFVRIHMPCCFLHVRGVLPLAPIQCLWVGPRTGK